jgi:NRPS condensation-like uncharacterized protein
MDDLFVRTQNTGIDYKHPMTVGRWLYRLPESLFNGCICVQGRLDKEALATALSKLAHAFPLIDSRVILDEKKDAWSVPSPEEGFFVRVIPREDDDHCVRRSVEELTIVFDLENEPPVRFTVLEGEQEFEIVITVHHALFDGKALIELIEDLMSLMGDPSQEVHPHPLLPPLNRSMLPKQKARPLTKIWFSLGRMLWGLHPLRFSEGEFTRLRTAHWDNHEVLCLRESLSPEELRRLKDKCRAEGVTINSALCAAFTISRLQMDEKYAGCRIMGIPMNLRPKMLEDPGRGPAMYSSTFFFNYTGEDTDLWAIARECGAGVKGYYDAYFSKDLTACEIFPSTAVDAYSIVPNTDEASKAVKLFFKHVVFPLPDGVFTISNLGVLNLPQEFGPYRLKRFFSVPAVVTNSALLGVVTINNTLTATLVCDPSFLPPEAARQKLDIAMNALREL